jgi:hypothetical protein
VCCQFVKNVLAPISHVLYFVFILAFEISDEQDVSICGCNVYRYFDTGVLHV